MYLCLLVYASLFQSPEHLLEPGEADGDVLRSKSSRPHPTHSGLGLPAAQPRSPGTEGRRHPDVEGQDGKPDKARFYFHTFSSASVSLHLSSHTQLNTNGDLFPISISCVKTMNLTLLTNCFR